MNKIQKTRLLWKEIGYRELFAYAKYRGLLSSGLIRKATPPFGWLIKRIQDPIALIDRFAFVDWTAFSPKNNPAIIPSLESINVYQNGKYLAFWGDPYPINLQPPLTKLNHWTDYQNDLNGQDIKLIWEPARFSWSLDMARIYALTGDESLPEVFWNQIQMFTQYNPPNLGPNWNSAQEVALRMISWLLALGSFQTSAISTEERTNQLLQSVWLHAKRILPTLNYARSQKNNHILSEALGLILAGDLFSPLSEEAAHWIETGRYEFETALHEQIDPEGNYSQHSSVYHRMMLHLALLYNAWLGKKGMSLSSKTLEKIKLATYWLIAQMDPVSGKLPNLGHNDGSLIFPLGCENFNDYRPTAQAAALAFLGEPCLPSGNWDELATWLGLSNNKPIGDMKRLDSKAIHKVGGLSAWGTLRGVRFEGRPAHADQLHVDLWWLGENIALDAGSYSYNSPPPWQNSLDSTRVHNTITIDGQDQMERVSRFLWLDHANAKWLESPNENSIIASHNGYRKLGIIHQRELAYLPEDHFRVLDELYNEIHQFYVHTISIHWLLPDWEFHFDNGGLVFSAGNRRIILKVNATTTTTHHSLKAEDFSIIRAGITLAGDRQDPILGWKSDTYLKKVPAVSISCTYKSALPLQIMTDWILLNE